MNLQEMFRQFFGSGVYPDYRRDFFEEHPEDEYRDQDPRNFGQEGSWDFQYGFIYSSPPFGIMRHFEDLFRNFGLVDFPSVGPQHFHELELPDREKNLNPRERMLKDQEAGPSFNKPWYEGILKKHEINNKSKTDTDLDAEVSQGGLFDIIPKPHVDRQEPRSFFRSVSVRTIRGTDGKFEEHRTVRDSTGKDETTVRRIIGNESHTVTTLKDGDSTYENIFSKLFGFAP